MFSNYKMFSIKSVVKQSIHSIKIIELLCIWQGWDFSLETKI